MEGFDVSLAAKSLMAWVIFIRVRNRMCTWKDVMARPRDRPLVVTRRHHPPAAGSVNLRFSICAQNRDMTQTGDRRMSYRSCVFDAA